MSHLKTTNKQQQQTNNNNNNNKDIALFSKHKTQFIWYRASYELAILYFFTFIIIVIVTLFLSLVELEDE